MAEIITAIICAVIALVSLVISIRSFKEKGFLFNNAYIWASEKERKSMDKKPHYRQTAIAFAFITALFICIALEALLQAEWMWIVSGAITLSVLVYAIVSSK